MGFYLPIYHSNGSIFRSNLDSIPKYLSCLGFLSNAPYSNQSKRENRQWNGKFKAFMLSMKVPYSMFSQPTNSNENSIPSVSTIYYSDWFRIHVSHLHLGTI